MSKIKLFIPPYSYQGKRIFEIFSFSKPSQLAIAEDARQFFELSTSIQDSDWIIIPVFTTELLDKSGRDLIKHSALLARENKKLLGVISNSDFIVDVEVDNAFVFTPGAYQSKPRQIALPATLPDDPYLKWIGTDWKPLPISTSPTVGFCGQATSHPLKALKDIYTFGTAKIKNKLGLSLSNPGPIFLPAFQRKKVLAYFEKDPRIQTDFILRDRYRGGAVNPSQKVQVEREFFQNINRNLFTVCLRGMGNYSVRFYQTLAMGRIPILIDTNEQLAFQQFNQLDRLIPVVSFEKIDHISSELLDFFRSRSNAELLDLQHTLRDIWKEYYQRRGLIQYFAKTLEKLNTNSQ